MKQMIVGLCVLLGATAPVWGVDIPLKSGEFIQAESYVVTGSFVMLKLANGSKVAYDLGDVDLEALRQQEAAAAAEAGEPAQEQAELKAPTLGSMAKLDRDRPKARITITDADVAHVGDTTAEPAPAADEAEDDADPAAGYTTGGQVLLDGVRIEAGDDEATWVINGRVVNRSSAPANDVRLELVITSPDNQPLDSPTLELAATLAPGAATTFSHQVESVQRPLVRGRTMWLQAAPESPQPGGQGSPPTGDGAAQPTDQPEIDYSG